MWAIQVAGNGEELVYFQKRVPSFRGMGIILCAAPGSIAAALELVKETGTNEQHFQETLAFENYVP